jgi:hypothetical protein
MTKVFIGGSRAVSRLNNVIRAQLDDLIRKGCAILIGDANGADRAVQQHFADRNYQNVVVFCMDRCRNNVGGWNVRSITSAGGKRDFAYYAEKDKVMAHEARCGVMLWDGESRGTLNNILTLLRDRKKALVYFSPTKIFHKLSTETDLQLLLGGGVAQRGKQVLNPPDKGESAQVRQLTLPQNIAGTRG